MNGTAIWETVKFILRLALLAGLPLLIAEGAELTGNWKTVFDTVLPILLPILDKFIHENKNISANGIVPF